MHELGDQVKTINIKRMTNIDFWSDLRLVDPQIIHAIAQPTNGSFIFINLLQESRLDPFSFTAKRFNSILSILKIRANLHPEKSKSQAVPETNQPFAFQPIALYCEL